MRPALIVLAGLLFVLLLWYFLNTEPHYTQGLEPRLVTRVQMWEAKPCDVRVIYNTQEGEERWGVSLFCQDTRGDAFASSLGDALDAAERELESAGGPSPAAIQ